MTDRIVPKDMRVGTLHLSNDYGDFLITNYIDSTKVGIYFLSTGYEAVSRCSRIRGGNVADRDFIEQRKARKLTQESLKELMNYDPETGILTWIKTLVNNQVKTGDVAGIKEKGGSKYYLRVGIYGKRHRCHRLAWLYMKGEWPKEQIDHIDGNGLNNKWENLRSVTIFENARNKRRPSNNTSGCVGVSWDKDYNKWAAQMGKVLNGKLKTIKLGRFINFNDAVIARKMAEHEYNYHINNGSERPL